MSDHARPDGQSCARGGGGGGSFFCSCSGLGVASAGRARKVGGAGGDSGWTDGGRVSSSGRTRV
eukprot:scaffold8051_cov114-Isochrysis_galbana.AAC.3